MLAIHPQAHTTPAVRVEIVRSPHSSGVLAKRYGVSIETIRKWRRRGPDACHDRSVQLHKLPWCASDEERAIVGALRRSTGFPLGALTFVVSHFLPHLNQDAVYRILRAEGLNRLPPAKQARKPHGTFKNDERFGIAARATMRLDGEDHRGFSQVRTTAAWHCAIASATAASAAGSSWLAGLAANVRTSSARRPISMVQRTRWRAREALLSMAP